MHENLKKAILTELEWTFARSSGPGGQHVNTTDSKARLSWDVESSQALSPHQKVLIKKKLHNYIKGEGLLKLSSSVHKQRESNKKDCIKKLFYLIEHTAFKKQKKRVPTKPTRASKEKRIKTKKSRSEIKRNRQKISF